MREALFQMPALLLISWHSQFNSAALNPNFYTVLVKNENISLLYNIIVQLNLFKIKYI